MDLQQFTILLASHPKSREAVLDAVQDIHLRSFTPADLCEHRVRLHSSPKRLVDDDAWHQAFWRLLWQHKGTLNFTPPSFAGFHEWNVVRVLPQGTEAEVTELRALSTCFSVHKTDSKWHQDIVAILWGCGFSVLHPDHINDPNRFELLQPHVHSGDEGFLTLLHEASEAFGADDQVRCEKGPCSPPRQCLSLVRAELCGFTGG